MKTIGVREFIFLDIQMLLLKAKDSVRLWMWNVMLLLWKAK